MAKKYADRGLAVLAIHVWDATDKEVAKFAKEGNLVQRILLDGRPVAKDYGVTGLPTLLWIGKDGQVVDVELSFDGPEALDRRTRALLDG